jgi:beta-glucosidase
MHARRSCTTLQIAMVVIVVTAGSAAQTTQTGSTPVYLDPSQSLADRVNDLLDKMTLEEKASQLVNQARVIPRLQIPAYNWGSEVLQGMADAGPATVFPEPIGLAATFDDSLIHDAAAAIATEARAKHNQAVKSGRRETALGLSVSAPDLNIFRDPRWGRGQETYGEDPYLTSRMGVALVTGLQGDDQIYLRVIATPKYFAVHSGPESAGHAMNAEVSKHDMEDTYLPGFRAAVVDGKAGSIMCANNSVNGEPACANTFLLQRQMRHAWKFTGYVVSDCDAVLDMVQAHHFAKTHTEAVADALKAGMDSECAGYDSAAKDDHDYAPFLDAVKLGLLSQLDIDRAIEHLFTARMRLGMFDPPEKVPYAQIPGSEIDSAAHRELALKAAKESMVLLKNDGILPLTAKNQAAKGPAEKGKKILVAGPLADSTAALEASVSAKSSHTVSALEGIRKQFGAALVSYAPGLADAVAAARRADVVVAVVGVNPKLEGEMNPGDEKKALLPRPGAGDRASLDLPQSDESLLQALKGTGKPLIVVLINGGALSINWANQNANAILEAWYAGEEGGTAIAQTLAGTNNPAGRLPVTFYRSVDQLPAFDDYSMSQRTYRYFEGEPLYPFGYGLSYSTFEYSNLKAPALEMKARDPLTVEVDVKNTSPRAGDEVAQLYLTFPQRPGAPLRALRGFSRVHLEAGEQKHLTFTLQSRELSHVDDWGDRLVGQGNYVVTVGGGQPGTSAPKAETHFTIRGDAVLSE